MTLQSVRCQECGQEIALVHPDEIKTRLDSGEYVNKRVVRTTDWQGHPSIGTEDGVFGMCPRCRQAQARRPVKGDSAAQADAQMIRIRDYVAEARRMMPQITTENAVKIAIEFEFDPRHEGDRAFRAYLLGEGAPKDPEIDAAARRFMENLPENSLIAPADNPTRNE